jgi:hypothetical protein
VHVRTCARLAVSAWPCGKRVRIRNSSFSPQLVANLPRCLTGNTGSNNYPLRGSKVSDFEGGVRAVSFLTGGYLPSNVRGTHHTGFIYIADWHVLIFLV